MEFPFIWVLIPLFGICAGMFKAWLRFRENQRQLGASNDQLEKLVAELRDHEKTLVHRLENLEAIVVSQTWDAVTDRSLPPVEQERRIASTVQREMPAPPVPDSQKAETLARRLRA